MKPAEAVGSMNRFAQLLDRLAYEHGRNAKLRLMTEYFRATPDPERGFTLAALTGALSFPHAKPGIIRALIAGRTDPVLFELSHDYVGDLSETVALLWPRPSAAGASSDPPMLSDVVTKLATLVAHDARRVFRVHDPRADLAAMERRLLSVAAALHVGAF